MARTQTTGVLITIQARATMARTELKGLRKDIGEFGKYVRDTFRGLGGGKVEAPKLSGEWRTLQREIASITADIKKNVDAIAAIKLRAPTVGTFLRNSSSNSTAAAAVAGSAAPTGVPTVSRAAEIEEAARLTREYKAGTIALEDYRKQLQGIAASATAGSEKQLDALIRLRGAEKALTAEAERFNKTQGVKAPSRASEIEEAAVLTRQFHAGTLSLNEYKRALEQVASAAVTGSEKELDALARVEAANKRAITQAKQLADQKQANRQNLFNRVEAGSQIATRTGDALTAGVTAPIVGTFVVAAREAINYEKALRNVNSIAKVNEVDFNKMYQAVLQIAKDPSIKQAPEDLAKALYDLQSAGFNDTSKFKALDVLKVSAKAATAGLSDTATASDALIGVLNSGIGGVTSAQQAMDVLFKTVDVGKLTFNDLATNLGKVLPTAAKAGVDINQLGAAFASMTINGMSAEDASTGLLNLISHIANPSKEAEKEFRRLGIAYSYAGLQAKGLPGILNEIQQKTGGNADAIKKLLPDMRAQRGALSLMTDEVKRYNSFTEQMKHANEGIGATQKALNEQTKAFSFQMDKLVQEFQILAAQAGPGIIQFLRNALQAGKPFLDMITHLAESFNSLTKEEQAHVLKMLAIAAAVGPILSGFGRIAGGINETVRLFQTLTPVATTAAGAVAKAGTQAATAAGEVTALSGALTALAALGIITVGVIATIYAYKYIGKPFADAVGDSMDTEQAAAYGGTAAQDAERGMAKYRPFAVEGKSLDENTKGDIYNSYADRKISLPKDQYGTVLYDQAAKDMYAYYQKMGAAKVAAPNRAAIEDSKDEAVNNWMKSVGIPRMKQIYGDGKPKPNYVQPPPGATGKGHRVSVPKVGKSSITSAEIPLDELNEQYSTGFTLYQERGDRMNGTQRQMVENALMGLANDIQTAQGKIAEETKKRVIIASQQRRAEAEKLNNTAKDQNDFDRAAGMIKDANTADADAEAVYTRTMAGIRRDHSAKYKAIYKKEEETNQAILEERAKDRQQIDNIEVQKQQARIAEIDQQISLEQDATKRQELLNQKFDAMDKAAVAKFDADTTAANAIQDPRQKKRAQNQAVADFTLAARDNWNQRQAAGLENDQLRLENEIKLHTLLANNTDDLIAKNNELYEVQKAQAELAKLQGVPEGIRTQQDAQADREKRAREAEIANHNGQNILLQAATQGTGSFAGTGWEGLMSQDEAGSNVMRNMLQKAFQEEYDKTEQTGKGKVASEQFDTLVKAVESNALTMSDILPLMRDIENRVNASGSAEARADFYKGFKEFFNTQLGPTFQKFDRDKGGKIGRENDYNALIAGVKNGTEFTDLSESQRNTLIKLIEKRRDQKDDTDKKPRGYEAIGLEASKALTESAKSHSGDFIAGLFGNHDKAKKAAEGFWGDITEVGRQSLGKAVNEELLKPIAKRITAGLSQVFKDGCFGIENSLNKSLSSFTKVFKMGAVGIAQAAVYLNGVLALAGKSGGRRGKKGAGIGAVLGLGLGLATGGTGLALLGAVTTGASAGSSVANGDLLGAAVSVGTGFMNGGAFAGSGGGGAVVVPDAGSTGGTQAAGGTFGGGGFGGFGKAQKIPSAFATAPAVAGLPGTDSANHAMISRLYDAVNGKGGEGQTFVLNDYGDKYTTGDTDRTIRKLGREVRDAQNRRS